MATILVTDDEAAIRTLLKLALQLGGHSVYLAANGLEAVAVFRSYARDIELVLMDMVMPVMDGAQAIDRIRETRPDVPIICMSGYSDEKLPHGVGFLQKPFGPAALTAMVDRLLAERRL
jgi:two-component system, cell cycle sensor histidine kinase and response regulator CckA